jgi:hypothetical protein
MCRFLTGTSNLVVRTKRTNNWKIIEILFVGLQAGFVLKKRAKSLFFGLSSHFSI